MKTEKNKKFHLFFYFLVFSVIIYLTFILHSGGEANDIEKNIIENAKPLDRSLYYVNTQWMFNGNIMQYSSYILLEKRLNKQRIEATFFQNVQVDKNQIACLVQNIRLNIEFRLNNTIVYDTVSKIAKKISCDISDYELNIEEIAVAIIINTEYGEDKFPIGMINYQIPEIIEVQEPRLPNVGLCINYVSSVYKGIYDWVKLQEKFKFAEIIIHDGSPDRSLKKLFGSNYNSNFLTIRDYNLTFNEICATKQINSYQTVYQSSFASYFNLCQQFHQMWFASINPFENHHNHISPNDCYISLGYKYEFVALFDLDELIIPRNYDRLKIIQSEDIYKCKENNKELCNLNPSSIPMYDYLVNIVNENFNYDISKLRSIAFYHGAYLIPNSIEIDVMNRIKEISDKIESKTLNETFPIRINYGLNLLINENDTEYILYLSKLYTEFSCFYNNYLSKMENFDKNLIRYLYFMTGAQIRLPKSIHYSKNVYILFTHDAFAFNDDSYILYPPWNQSHINSHFRADLEPFFRNNFQITIKDFSFDFEYTYFLLQTYSKICK